MTQPFIKKYSIFILLLMTPIFLIALDSEDRVKELEKKMSQIRTETAMKRYGAQTASARPQIDGQGWFINADILYWHAKVGGTEYAYSDDGREATSSNINNIALPIKGRNKDIQFNWDWGFRIGLGYRLEHEKWNISGVYTSFKTNGSHSSEASPRAKLIPLRGTSTITAQNIHGLPKFLYSTEAKSHYKLDLDTLDLELGHSYFVSRYLSCRPFWGFKTSWIEQEQKVRYTGGHSLLNGESIVSVLGVAGNTVLVRDTVDFLGLGPRAGFDTKWHIGNGFSIFGSAATSLQYGYFDVKHKESYSGLILNEVNLSADKHIFSPTAQMKLGIFYEKYLYDKKQYIEIGLGIEVQYWWRQNQMLKIDDVQTLKYERYSEDVSMHGVTLDFKWDF